MPKGQLAIGPEEQFQVAWLGSTANRPEHVTGGREAVWLVVEAQGHPGGQVVCRVVGRQRCVGRARAAIDRRAAEAEHHGRRRQIGPGAGDRHGHGRRAAVSEGRAAGLVELPLADRDRVDSAAAGMPFRAGEDEDLRDQHGFRLQAAAMTRWSAAPLPKATRRQCRSSSPTRLSNRRSTTWARCRRATARCRPCRPAGSWP